ALADPDLRGDPVGAKIDPPEVRPRHDPNIRAQDCHRVCDRIRAERDDPGDVSSWRDEGEMRVVQVATRADEAPKRGCHKAAARRVDDDVKWLVELGG